MRTLTLLLLMPAALFAGQARYARLGEFQGKVEVQLTAADPWIAAERNLPLTESAWIRTGPAAHVEIELDDGSAWRLGPESQGELSDYSRLSTGQRITLLSLDHGTCYFTGQPAGKDVITIVLPGAQMTILEGSRIRATADAVSSQFAVFEGQARFSSPAAELPMREGTTARVEQAAPSRFSLDPEVTPESLDRWSEDRDKALAAPESASHVSARFGLADLDSAGKWLATPDFGMVWKPDADSAWAPYQKGRWRYLDTLGYTWVSDDPWGWLPYHNGRWARAEGLGWIWQPSANPNFHPAEVYWLRGANFAGWGPLAPGELWANPLPASPPVANRNGVVTYAAFQADARTIDPAGFPTPSADQLKTAVFVPALPSPALDLSRLDATRPTLSAGSTRVLPSVPGVTFGDIPPVEPPSDLMTNPSPQLPPPPVSSDAAGATPPPDGVYPVPPAAIPVIEIPVLVINPPDHPDYARRPPFGNNGSGNQGGGNGNQNGSPLPPFQSGQQTGAPPVAPATGLPPRPPANHPTPVTAPPTNQPARQAPPPPTSEPVRPHPEPPPAAVTRTTPPEPVRERPATPAQSVPPPAPARQAEPVRERPSAPPPAASPAPRVEAPKVEAPKVDAPKAADPIKKGN